ncbi:hypothetical protein JXE04_03330 [Patescibacteria group bacterium]|nr:hypothetical protein [Patescibacteria group bacterium]
MNRNQVIGTAVFIAIIAVIAIFFLTPYSRQGETTVNNCPQSDTQVVVGLPVSSDSLVRMYQENSRLKAKNEEFECEKITNELESEIMELKAENKKLRREIDALKKGGATRQSSQSISAGQNVSSTYNEAKATPVTNTYTTSVPDSQEFCGNIRTGLDGERDSGSFWPHIEGDPPTSIVAEAVPNASHTGWNIKLPPVNEITGLYGWSDNLGVIFVRADILDKFGPTNVSMAGGMTGWPKIWTFAQKENINGTEYYVAHYK